MARNEAIITPQLLIWARERVSMSLETAAKAAGVKPERFQSWEEGQAFPTVNQAKSFAKKVRVPFAYFFLSDPPKKCKLSNNTDYRTFANQPLAKYSLELQYLCLDIYSRRDAMIELYNDLGLSIKIFDQYADIQKVRNSSISQLIRSMLQLTIEKQTTFRNSNKAFNYYLETVSSLGILVFQSSKVSKNEMRGMSIYDPIFPIIVVNRKDEYNARIFTLFHELVHILTRTPGICDTLDLVGQSPFEIELKCNSIAAEALVPDQYLFDSLYYQQLIGHNWSDELVYKLAKDFSVSREVIIGRLLALNKISFDFYMGKLKQYSDEYKQYQSTKKKDNGFLPPSNDICSQVGKLYARTVMNAYNQELITARDASQFLSGLRMQHFDKVERWCFS